MVHRVAGRRRRPMHAAEKRRGRPPMRLPTDLWVLLPAALLLLGFLCLLPFTRAFRGTTGRERGVYITAVVATVNGVLLLAAAAAYPTLLRAFGRWGERLLLLPRLVFAGRVALTVGVVLTVDIVAHRIAGEAMGVIAGLGVACLIAMSAPNTVTNNEE